MEPIILIPELNKEYINIRLIWSNSFKKNEDAYLQPHRQSGLYTQANFVNIGQNIVVMKVKLTQAGVDFYSKKGFEYFMVYHKDMNYKKIR